MLKQDRIRWLSTGVFYAASKMLLSSTLFSVIIFVPIRRFLPCSTTLPIKDEVTCLVTIW